MKPNCNVCRYNGRSRDETHDKDACHTRWKKAFKAGSQLICFSPSGCMEVTDEQELEKLTEILT